MDFNQLRTEWAKPNAIQRLKEVRYHIEDGFIHTQMRKEMEGLTSIERAEYLEIVAGGKGVLPVRDRREIVSSARCCLHGVDGFLTHEEIKLFTKTFLKSQEEQFKTSGRDMVAEELKRLNREGMSFHNRKRFLVESADQCFPVKEKGESMLKKALTELAEAQKAAHHGCKKKQKEI